MAQELLPRCSEAFPCNRWKLNMSSTSPVPRRVCRSPSGLMQPDVRYDVVDGDNPREALPLKLSRPQKRRKRLQTLAVHRD